MSNKKTVTELDFRMPEFRDAKVEDYEFRDDGRLVRKDRWEQAVSSIRFLVGISGRGFEIEEVVQRVRTLAADEERWDKVENSEDSDFMSESGLLDLRLEDGSVLMRGEYDRTTQTFTWRSLSLKRDEVYEWRSHRGAVPESED